MAPPIPYLRQSCFANGQGVLSAWAWGIAQLAGLLRAKPQPKVVGVGDGVIGSSYKKDQSGLRHLPHVGPQWTPSPVVHCACRCWLNAVIFRLTLLPWPLLQSQGLSSPLFCGCRPKFGSCSSPKGSSPYLCSANKLLVPQPVYGLFHCLLGFPLETSSNWCVGISNKWVRRVPEL